MSLAPVTAEKPTPAATTGVSPAPGKFRPSVPWLRKTEYMSAIENLNRSKLEERNLLKKYCIHFIAMESGYSCV